MLTTAHPSSCQVIETRYAGLALKGVFAVLGAPRAATSTTPCSTRAVSGVAGRAGLRRGESRREEVRGGRSRTPNGQTSPAARDTRQGRSLGAAAQRPHPPPAPQRGREALRGEAAQPPRAGTERARRAAGQGRAARPAVFVAAMGRSRERSRVLGARRGRRARRRGGTGETVPWGGRGAGSRRGDADGG